MRDGIHFISGLPRSGSTLLSALLRQNPAAHASITSPVAPITLAVLREMSAANEGEVFIDDAKREAIVRGVFSGFYARERGAKTIFDTNRLWTSKLSLLTTLFPQAKVVCCVRDVPWIYDSFERLIRRNRFQPSRIFDFDAGGNVYTRFNQLNAPTGIVGFAWTCLRQAFFGEATDRLLLVTYESLVAAPQTTLDAIYDFVGMPRFAHDLENIEIEVGEFDARLGAPGLHSVGKTIHVSRRATILPPELYARVDGDTFWRDPLQNPRAVKIL
ncbi:MAG: sulfotransferase [Roseiarcus sp.]